jgi:CheY-like chemotaxis protein
MNSVRLCANSAVAPDGNPVRVLVVEDELLIRLVIADALRDEGYEVVEAFNGDEAVDILKADASFDVVVSDVRMPGSIDGLALLDFVRLNHAAMPVILASGHLAPADALARGAAEFLSKPYTMSQALKAVEFQVSTLE